MKILYLARGVAIVAFLALLLLILGLPLVIYGALTGNVTPIYRTGIWGAALGLRLSGIDVRAHGLDKVVPGQTYVYMANHQSHTDPPALLTRIPQQVGVVLKKELGLIPILGRAMRLAGFVFVDRGNRESGHVAVEKAAHSIGAGRSFMVFPEGTRSPDGQLRAFKTGGFVMAILAQVPILPVTIVGSRERMPKGTLLLRPGTIDLYFHEPVPTAGRTVEEKAAVVDKVRQKIASKL